MTCLRVLLIAPNIDGTDVGEAFVAFKWAEALAELVDLTVLSFERPGRKALAEQLPGARVVSWPEPSWALRHERLNAMLIPAWPVFCGHVRSWIKAEKAAGAIFDVAHQLMPQAARYASPLTRSGIPHVIGPLGGALDTPAGFVNEMGTAAWYTRLRRFDRTRLRFDPWLRRSYSEANLVLGVAPYMLDVLSSIALKRFEPVLELGIDAVAENVARQTSTDRLKLLHVGRGVRTKGLRDVVRALALLKDRPGITLISAGAGEEIDICRSEAKRLGVVDRVRFLGEIPRAEVEDLYRQADVFAFPSFREPAGGVLYEAMRWGLPIISTKRGGPNWIVDDSCGLRLNVTTPEALAIDIAAAVRRLADDPGLRRDLGSAARDKVAREGLWQSKAASLVGLYESIL